MARRSKKIKKFKVTKEILVAIVVIALIAVIVLGTLYFVNRDLFNKIIGLGDDRDVTNGTVVDGNFSFTTSYGVFKNESIEDKLEVHFIDIGQGDSMIIRFPDGKSMMIDAGGEFSEAHRHHGMKVYDKIINYVRDLGITTIDAMLLTHSDKDHCGCMDEVIEAFEVKKFFLPDFSGGYEATGKDGEMPTNTCGKVYKLAHEETYTDENGSKQNASIVYNIDEIDNLISTQYGYSVKSYCRSADYYDTVTTGDAKELNSVSPITILEYANTTVMFTGDGEGEGKNDVEHWFIDKGIKIDVDVLKVGHHGSAAGTTMDFLEYIDPEYAIISCGAKSRHGHPTPETLDKLNTYRDIKADGDANGLSRVYRTDLDGSIVLTIDSKPKENENKNEGESVSAILMGEAYYKRNNYALVA